MKIEYRLIPKWLWFYSFILGLYLLGLFLVLYSFVVGTVMAEFEKFCLLPVLFLNCIVVGTKSFHDVFLKRLTLSPNGIEHCTFGYTVSFDWANIKRVQNSRVGLRTFDGIYIDKSASNIKVWFPDMLPEKEIFIPLSRFSENWRDSELGQQIKQHASQLFSSVEN